MPQPLRTLAAGLGGALVAGLLLAAPASAQALPVPLPLGDPTVDQEAVTWLCRPGLADDPCEIPLDTTVRSAEGERVVTPARPPQDRRPVDCFYVYPTVSNQLTPNADKSRAPEVVSIATYQAAPFSTQCRMFAPVYRQATIASIQTRAVTDQKEVRELAFSDVQAAWRQYLAQDNGGRGVVLLGHSQGTGMLRALIRAEIDGRPVQRRLVGAVLLGGDVVVAKGRTTGGDFRSVPTCTRPGEAGCVVAFSTFAQDPPDDTRFGTAVADDDDPFGFPSGPGFEVACTDPGRLSGSTGPVGVTVPTEPYAPGPIAAGIVVTNGGPPPTADTTWVQPADRFAGSCRTVNGANVLRYDALPGSRTPRDFPDDTWGTHLVDVNYGLERQVAIVAAQARTYLRTAAAAPGTPAPARPAAGPPATPAPVASAQLPATGGAATAGGLAGLLLLGALGARRLSAPGSAG